MNKPKGTLKICPKGHSFYKSSDCPTCPVCEQEKKPTNSFLSLLGAPARRALENNGIRTLEELSRLSPKEVLSFHGMGKASIPILTRALNEQGLGFKEE